MFDFLCFTCSNISERKNTRLIATGRGKVQGITIMGEFWVFCIIRIVDSKAMFMWHDYEDGIVPSMASCIQQDARYWRLLL